MADRNERIPPVDDFLTEYRRELDRLKENARNVLMDCYIDIGEKYPDDPFSDIKKEIESMESFCRIREKSDDLVRARARCSNFFNSCGTSPKDEKLLKKFDDFREEIEEIIRLKDFYVNLSLEHAAAAYNAIQDCPYGLPNNNKNNRLFERKVLEFFDWLFISELQRIQLRRLETGRVRRDGAYKALEEFDARTKCGFKFQHLFVECKNYKEPKYPALMQVFVYTLTCQDTDISKVPLYLLVSRKNPTRESTTWRIRRVIFDKRMGKETRLILFLDVGDLGNMLDHKKEGFDPVVVLREKVEELEMSNIQQGGI